MDRLAEIVCRRRHIVEHKQKTDFIWEKLYVSKTVRLERVDTRSLVSVK